mmetsp:Transcript_815/g.2454  ORF Transcript_815/g.2454 Transcript_815/m.2454 type:complete len:224 (-) Transcript_815:591-1262(-)
MVAQERRHARLKDGLADLELDRLRRRAHRHGRERGRNFLNCHRVSVWRAVCAGGVGRGESGQEAQKRPRRSRGPKAAASLLVTYLLPQTAGAANRRLLASFFASQKHTSASLAPHAQRNRKQRCVATSRQRCDRGCDSAGPLSHWPRDAERAELAPRRWRPPTPSAAPSRASARSRRTTPRRASSRPRRPPASRRASRYRSTSQKSGSRRRRSQTRSSASAAR